MLDVLLYHFLLSFFGVFQNISQLPRAVNIDTPRVVRWLNDPNVARTIYLPVLGNQSLQGFVKSHDFELVVSGEAYFGQAFLEQLRVEVHHLFDLDVRKTHT